LKLTRRKKGIIKAEKGIQSIREQMKLDIFDLERIQSLWENRVPVNLTDDELG
jgi:hypothetical protein